MTTKTSPVKPVTMQKGNASSAPVPDGFPISEAAAYDIASTKKILKYPTTARIYLPNDRAPQPGEIFKNPDLAATLKKLVEAQKSREISRPSRRAPGGARSLLQGRYRAGICPLLRSQRLSLPL